MLYVCLSAEGVDNAMRQLGDNKCAELRVDLVKPTADEMIQMLSAEEYKYIVTCRPGVYEQDYDISMLETAALNGAEYIDLELERAAEFSLKLRRACLLSKKCKLIISYHNYETTPDAGILKGIIKYCKELGADIVKMACKSNSVSDNARILGLYGEYNDIVAFCMGETGKITRAASVMMGAPFTYAAADDGAPTAPGQLTIKQIKKILDAFESAH